MSYNPYLGGDSGRYPPRSSTNTLQRRQAQRPSLNSSFEQQLQQARPSISTGRISRIPRPPSFNPSPRFVEHVFPEPQIPEPQIPDSTRPPTGGLRASAPNFTDPFSAQAHLRASRSRPPTLPGYASENPVAPNQMFRGRAHNDSEATLYEDNEDSRYSMSSYQHPYDIPPPRNAYMGNDDERHVDFRNSEGTLADTEAQTTDGKDKYDNVRLDDDEKDMIDDEKDGDDDNDVDYCDVNDRDGRRRGLFSNLIDLYGVDAEGDNVPFQRRRFSQLDDEYDEEMGGAPMRRSNSDNSQNSQLLDPDDPTITGVRKKCLDDYDDEKRTALRQMDYRRRRKEKQKIKIEFNVTSIIHRHNFLLKLAKALMTFGAPSHRIESQLLAAARILEIDAEFIHLPSVIICSFGDNDTMTSETHFIKSGGGLSLGSLHKVHIIYRGVVHDEVSARKATEQLDDLLSAKPLYPWWFRCILSFWLSVLICPLAFGGSFIDMGIAGCGAFVLCFLQLRVAAKSAMYANVFEITTAMLVSFTARGLSSIRSQIFCYTAVSSSAIIGILPGYLILSSSLELASKNIVCGSVKMVYALIYTLFLGFGLQIGSDLYLLFDPTARHHLTTLAADISTSATIIGTFAADNSTSGNSSLSSGLGPVYGTFTFTNNTNVMQTNIIDGCYRPKHFGWYLQPFPFWTQFLIVPLFSILSSLANLQPWRSRQLPVMVVISCASYASNKVANHYIFNRSDIVSAIGAFTVGLLGNVYSRKMGGTAFTSMVTGVLFLVPSGLSQAGGITADGSGVDIGSAMIAVTIGITVGLFMSQALVYMFGTRKNAAVFSF